MKSQHKILLLTALCLSGGRAGALSLFECVRDLLPITELAIYQVQRKGVEKPFVLDGKFLVFPAVEGRSLQGFYVYSENQARYFDSVEGSESVQRISALAASEPKEYRLVGKGEGIEVFTLLYNPAYRPRDDRHKELYHQPPAAQRGKELPPGPLLHLRTEHAKSGEALWAPLKSEFKLRKTWIQENNLNEESFRRLSTLMKGSCQD